MHKRMSARGCGSGGTAVARRRARLALPLLACLAAAAFAAPAQATFHEMSIREVYPGGPNNASYVELQMWAGAQNFVATHHLVAYNSDGSVNDNFAFAANVANGEDQSTILVADSEYSIVFDERPLSDETDANLNLSPTGGAVCWVEGSPPDCVAWGDFKGPLPAHIPALKVGNPASPGEVTAGKALQRSIAKGCATMLEPSFDDSDDSATDFSEVEPNPRDNAMAPAETPCNVVSIEEKPAALTKETSAHFTYRSSSEDSAFECKLDAATFVACPKAGVEYTALGDALHTFQVRAKNPGGTGAAVSFKWTVDTTPPTAEVKTHPASPSRGDSAAFTYASEAGASFECNLHPAGNAGAFKACEATGKSYPDAEHPGPLADGEWVFEVRATDKAGNQGTAAEFSWEVNNSLEEESEEEPEEEILLPMTKPPDLILPSLPLLPETPAPQTKLVKAIKATHDRTPAFRFRSSSAGARFQCKIDSGPYKPCRSPFTAPTLTFGHHVLKVRAVLTGVPDPTPAVARFTVTRS
jgi:hypothetical protein